IRSRKPGRSYLPALAAVPVVDLAGNTVLLDSVTLLDLAFELIALACDLIEIVIGQLAPLFLDLALELLPVAFHSIPVHLHAPCSPRRGTVHARIGSGICLVSSHMLEMRSSCKFTCSLKAPPFSSTSTGRSPKSRASRIRLSSIPVRGKCCAGWSGSPRVRSRSFPGGASRSSMRCCRPCTCRWRESTEQNGATPPARCIMRSTIERPSGRLHPVSGDSLACDLVSSS